MNDDKPRDPTALLERTKKLVEDIEQQLYRCARLYAACVLQSSPDDDIAVSQRLLCDAADRYANGLQVPTPSMDPELVYQRQLAGVLVDAGVKLEGSFDTEDLQDRIHAEGLDMPDMPEGLDLSAMPPKDTQH